MLGAWGKGALGGRALLLFAALVACGPKSGFRLSSDDNNRSALVAALAARHLPAHATPTNSAQQPRVFVLVAGSPKTIVAYDLASGAQLWAAAADVKSRISVGGDFVVELEGKHLVARDQQKGTPRWKVEVPGSFVGATADRERAYMVWRIGDDQHPTWRLAAYDGTSGDQLWKQDAEGRLGAPIAHGGLVYSPFLTQWLSLVDGKTGKQLARILNNEEQITMVRVTSQHAFYGSKQGVMRLDERSASGTRAGSTYGQVKIPPQLDRASYGRDVYDPAQAGYTAADRARVLFAAGAGEAGPLVFDGDRYAIHYFRYVLGFSTKGDLEWAYSHPRVELVASEHTGAAIVAVAQNGELVALDPKTGALREKIDLHASAPVLGATFDADGWAPAAKGDAQPVETAQALVAIVRDRDARFDRVKELALGALAKLPGGDVTRALLGVMADARAPGKLKELAADLVVRRKDPESLQVLVEQLQVKTDFIAKTEPAALAQVAKAVGGLAGMTLDANLAARALDALRDHLDAPTTQTTDLVFVIDALAALGGAAAKPALESHLLLYHADELGADPAWDKAIVHAVHHRAGPEERELLLQVAADPRTKPSLATAIREAMSAPRRE